MSSITLLELDVNLSRIIWLQLIFVHEPAISRQMKLYGTSCIMIMYYVLVAKSLCELTKLIPSSLLFVCAVWWVIPHAVLFLDEAVNDRIVR